MKVVICGSTNSSLEQIDLAARIFKNYGNTVVTPCLSPEMNLIQKRWRYLEEIDSADLVVIVTKGPGGDFCTEREGLLYRIGTSTCYEYLYAVKKGVPTVIWDHPNHESDAIVRCLKEFGQS